MGPRLQHRPSQCSWRAVGLEIVGFVQALSADSLTPQGNACKGKALLALTGGFAIYFRYFCRYIPKGENTQLSNSQHCHIHSPGMNLESLILTVHLGD